MAMIEGPLVPATGGCEDDCGSDYVKDTMSMSDTANPLGIVVDTAPYEIASLVVPIGREARDYRLTLGTYLWAPLTISSVEWSGQYFNRTRRV